MSRRLVTVTQLVAVATPDTPNIARAHTIASRMARPMQGRNGVVGYDRGDPAHSFTGPVAGATNPDTAIGQITTDDANIPYMPPAYQDAAIIDTPLGALSRAQYNRMISR